MLDETDKKAMKKLKKLLGDDFHEERQRWLTIRTLVHVSDIHKLEYDYWRKNLKLDEESRFEAGRFDWLQLVFKLGEYSVRGPAPTDDVLGGDKRTIWVRDLFAPSESQMDIQQLSLKDRALLRKLWMEFFDFYILTAPRG